VAVLATVATAIVEVGFVELLPLTGTYILRSLAYESRLVRVAIGRRLDLSYGIYLYAWPVQQLLVQGCGRWLNPWTLSLSVLIVSGGLAWLSWTAVERPFLALERPGRPQNPTTGSHEVDIPSPRR
jgi:peptidoglycan/LPS O-acetylase OafA/YrhL